MKEKLRDIVLECAKGGNIIYNTIEGPVEAKLKDFLAQPVDGILYELNRSEEVILTFIDDPKWVNDFAACKVIRELYSQVSLLKSKAEKWDSLGDKIAKCYDIDENGEFVDDLGTIGEIAATAYGYL